MAFHLQNLFKRCLSEVIIFLIGDEYSDSDYREDKVKRIKYDKLITGTFEESEVSESEVK